MFHLPRPDKPKVRGADIANTSEKVKKHKDELILAVEHQACKVPKAGPDMGKEKAEAAEEGTGKWCSLHRSNGHNLKQCRKIHNFIEDRLRGRRVGNMP